MDCNKEEAIRAKGIAEKKMETRDFAGAHRFALKAQQLHTGLDNISQMLMVCEVHCAADQKLNGNEMDWYAILQIQQTADEATIKKQYRKFALQLHPDKNKFPGAEAAFKLIGEAQALLLDKGKRYLHDTKRKASAHNPAPPYRYQQGGTYSANMNYGVQKNARGNFKGVNLQDPRPQQPAMGHGFPHVLPTFWTMCPFCTKKYEYYINFINRTLTCPNCNKNFVAYQSVRGAPPPATNLNQTTFHQRKDVSGAGDCNMESRSQHNFAAERSNSGKFSTGKVNGKRRRKHEDSSSSESFDNDGSSSDSDEEVPAEEDGDFKAKVDVQGSGDHPRRSARMKKQVSYKENLSDEDDNDDVGGYSKKLKGSGVSALSQGRTQNGLKEESPEMKKPCDMAADVTEAKEKVTSGCKQESFKANSTSPPSSDSKRSSDQDLSCPDPEFFNFDSQRNETCFSQGQIWAIYDDRDAMPRFYARIVKVLSPGFKLRITWLEPCPDDEDERDWDRENIPAGCGEFKHGTTEDTKKHNMFSHLVCWEKGRGRSTYKILPRKGEVWALFSNWEEKGNQKYDFEFVEILSDFTEVKGSCVAFLDRLKGFVSLFCQTNKERMKKVQIPPDELFRFSHMVPSVRLTGEERDGVPRGSFELDPSALPPTC